MPELLLNHSMEIPDAFLGGASQTGSMMPWSLRLSDNQLEPAFMIAGNMSGLGLMWQGEIFGNKTRRAVFVSHEQAKPAPLALRIECHMLLVTMPDNALEEVLTSLRQIIEYYRSLPEPKLALPQPQPKEVRGRFAGFTAPAPIAFSED